MVQAVHTVHSFLARQSKLSLLLLSMFFVLALGTVDHTLGPDLSFSVFYSAPVLLSAWYTTKKGGIFISVSAALTWLIADLTAGSHYPHPLIPLWNCLVRLGFFVIITLLTSIIRKKLDREESLAETDYLTGLKNSRSFYEHCESEVVRSRRYKRPLTVAYIDLDNFKPINDKSGHATGDDVLRTVAGTIHDNVRQSDVISRLGGDEFALLFPETDYRAGQAIMKSLVARLSESMERNGWPISFSIGAVTFPVPTITVRDMIKKVDDLMYDVKKSGKNSIMHEEWSGK